MTAPDKVLNLVLEVATFLGVVTILSMESTVPPLVTPLGMYEIMVCIIPASAWTWLVRSRKASAVTMGGAGFDTGEGNPGPVCARPPASQSLRHSVELVRMSDDSGLGLGGMMLEWGSPGEEGVVPLGLAPGSCKEVGSGRSFYSGCCRLFVPDDLTTFMTHHAVAPFTMPSRLSTCLPPWQRGVRLQVGGADLTCARSVVR
ncbi:hypothetical protein GW17_00040541 [Ensete ventricosum]|nr:hypothetical protein GW17_00040541 [Ensete ventricosum]